MDKKIINRNRQQDISMDTTQLHNEIEKRLAGLGKQKPLILDDNYYLEDEDFLWHIAYIKMFYMNGYTRWDELFRTKDGY
jgi:hypothetical protein